MKTKRTPSRHVYSFLTAALITAVILAILAIKQPWQTPESPQIPGRPRELPSLVPTDFPIYPDATVIRMETNPPDEFLVVFTTVDPRARVYDKLLADTKAAGWQTEEVKQGAFRATKGTSTITLIVTQNPGEQTAILVQVAHP